MKKGYIIKYYNDFLSFKSGYDFLRVVNKIEDNKIEMIWWEEDDYKHKGTIGQWRIKKTK